MKTKNKYNLFRAKITRPIQLELPFHSGIEKTPQAIFAQSLLEQTSIKYRESTIWKAGSINEFSDDGGYFAFGKISLADLELFDNFKQDFYKIKSDIGLHSIIVYSKKYELLAIQVNHKLGRTEKTAERLQAILKKSQVIVQNGLHLSISKINDPKKFISKLQDAYAIKQLRATFSRPNPFDADEKFQKPSAELLQAVNGDEGSTVFKGSNLDYEVIEAISRSTVATGNVAKARILTKPNSHLSTISTKGDPYTLTYDKGKVEPIEVYNDMIRVYKEIRDGEENAKDKKYR